jgi:hypothetical protein
MDVVLATAGTATVARKVAVVKLERWNGQRPRRVDAVLWLDGIRPFLPLPRVIRTFNLSIPNSPAEVMSTLKIRTTQNASAASLRMRRRVRTKLVDGVGYRKSLTSMIAWQRHAGRTLDSCAKVRCANQVDGISIVVSVFCSPKNDLVKVHGLTASVHWADRVEQTL